MTGSPEMKAFIGLSASIGSDPLLVQNVEHRDYRSAVISMLKPVPDLRRS
jgi:hypothetical protein